MGYPDDITVSGAGEGLVLTTTGTGGVQFADLQSETTDRLQEQVDELNALIEYAMSVSPEFKRIVTAFKTKKRIT